jgi:nuclear GTP-binding protein
LRVAHKRGKLKRGGIPDVDAAARIVLHDWNDGRIPFFTRAPAVESCSVSDTKIVSEPAEQLTIDDIALAGAGSAMVDGEVFVPRK